MRISRASLRVAVAVGIAVLAGVAPASAANAGTADGTHTAAVSKAKKLKRLKALTQPEAASFSGWRYTRIQAKAGQDMYRFNWSTDYCTNLKDKPGGFDFRLSCARHDFGYRNYKELIGKKAFKGSAHERRVDRAFLYDMRQQCMKQPGKTGEQRAKCLTVALAYYNRVS